jgi:predicted secreted protein
MASVGPDRRKPAMTTPMGIAIYFTIWWIVLFAILPWGVHSQQESGEVVAGTDPGAPVAPRLLIKAVATTIVSAILFAGLWVFIEYAS